MQTLNVDYLKGQSQILNIVQKDNIKNNLLTLFVGIAGAWVGYILNIPLGPMLGALVFVLIAKRTYSALKLSRYFSSLALCLSGIFMGSRFPKDFSSAFFSWETSLLAVPLFVLVSVLSISLYLKFVPKYNLSTSVLSAFPGGILTMIGLGSATKSREDIILSTHTIRIIMTVVTIPFVLTFYGYRAGENILSEDEIFTLSDFTSYEILVVLSVSILSLIFAKIIKLPAGELVGPMFGVGFLYSVGMVVGEIPSIILIFVLWLLGIKSWDSISPNKHSCSVETSITRHCDFCYLIIIFFNIYCLINSIFKPGSFNNIFSICARWFGRNGNYWINFWRQPCVYFNSSCG